MKGILAALVLLVPFIGHAHTEHDKSRFVAIDGVDEGRCDNRFRPCKSISYAARQANKGDIVKVAKGHYKIESSAEHALLNSKILPVLGGYSRHNHFQSQDPLNNPTMLSGLTSQARQFALDRGFSLLADGKALSSIDENTGTIPDSVQFVNSAICNEGMAETYACNAIDLLGHMPLSELPTNSSSANDIWGHVDLNTGKEYAIIGLRRGVAVVDVTVPDKLEVVGSLPGQSTTWRDIKVFQRFNSDLQRWQAWAYVTADSANDGLMIIDLNDLSNGITLTNRDSTDRSAHNVYISGVDYSLNVAEEGVSPLIHILGASNYGGALRSYDVKSPDAPKPSYVPEKLTRSDYTHDASSLIINDERADLYCSAARNNECTVLLDFNENEMRLWDATNSSSPSVLSDTGYANSEYTHSGWWSEDKRYVILHDELDEQRLSLNTQVYVFDISQLDNPVLASVWEGPTGAIDHNGFVRGNRYYMSNYERGLTILDISNPEAPEEIGFFDTYPTSDNNSFNGAWGVYPFLPSGNILVSDIQRGLFVLADKTQQDESHIGFGPYGSFDEGQAVTLPVVRDSGTQAASVEYSVVFGSASASDIGEHQGIIQWANNDQETKFIVIPTVSDSTNEGNEEFYVRLHNPQNTYLEPNARIAKVVVEDQAEPVGQAVFAVESLRLLENQSTFELSAVRTGGQRGELRVSVSLDGNEGAEDLRIEPDTLVWSNDDTSEKTVFLTPVDDSLEEGDENYSLRIGNSTIAVTIRDDETNQPPESSAGDDISTNPRATVNLRGSGSDSDGEMLSYTWSQEQGTSVTLADASSAQTQFTAPESGGNLVFRLEVSDEFGASSSDTVSVFVSAPTNNAPQENGSSSGGGSLQPYLLLMMLMSVVVRRRKKKAAY